MKKLIRLRRLAFELQLGRCYYCRTPMWLEHPRDVFGHRDLPSKVAGYFKCTAEHLKPVSEGGKDEPGNIVAACEFCNRTRHRAKEVLSPERYARRVRARIALGRWHIAAIGSIPTLERSAVVRTSNHDLAKYFAGDLGGISLRN